MNVGNVPGLRTLPVVGYGVVGAGRNVPPIGVGQLWEVHLVIVSLVPVGDGRRRWDNQDNEANGGKNPTCTAHRGPPKVMRFDT